MLLFLVLPSNPLSKVSFLTTRINFNLILSTLFGYQECAGRLRDLIDSTEEDGRRVLVRDQAEDREDHARKWESWKSERKSEIDTEIRICGTTTRNSPRSTRDSSTSASEVSESRIKNSYRCCTFPSDPPLYQHPSPLNHIYNWTKKLLFGFIPTTFSTDLML